MPATLSSEDLHAYLDSKPSWIVLTTIGRDGFPHSVPLGYFRVGDEIYLGCRAGTQKLHNIGRNPKVSLLLQTGSTRADIKGVMIQGEATVLDQPEDVLRLSREAALQRGAPEAELPSEARPGAAYVRVAPHRVILWDYGREG